MALFRRPIPDRDSLREEHERREAERMEQQQAIRRAGPRQPCMSTFAVTAMTYGVCQTRISAGTPHEHRGLDAYRNRGTAAWGTGRGNPFEDDDRERADEAWLTQDQADA